MGERRNRGALDAITAVTSTLSLTLVVVTLAGG
jgi:hypothetical protein